MSDEQVAVGPAPAVIPAARAPRGLEARVARFLVVTRWLTLGTGITVALARGETDADTVVAVAALVSIALFHTLRPTGRRRLSTRGAGVAAVVELGLTLAVIATTGGTESPFVLTPVAALVLAGYGWGRRPVVGAAAAGSIAVVSALAIQVVQPGAERSAGLLGVLYLLCAVLGAFARTLVSELEAHQAATADQVAALATANDLLVALHAVAQTLPASLDLGDVLGSARTRLRQLFPATALTVVVRDDASGTWRVELADGVRLPATLHASALPAPLRRLALGPARPMLVSDHLVGSGRGCAPQARSGIYAPLEARGSVVGLVAVEHDEPRKYAATDLELLGGVGSSLALAVDNARWFERLRHFGAEAERARIARELHDRIAQSLAYVGFELERMSRGAGDKQAELDALHEVVRDLVGELRDTLYQLRVNVTEDRPLDDVARAYLDRYEERTGIAVSWTSRVEHRLPFQIEQEIWRILQEALTNVERHSGSRAVEVRWEVDGTRARLAVVDQGRGFRTDHVGGEHYGLVGMRERADALGGHLDVESAPGRGTAVLLELDAAASAVAGPPIPKEGRR